MKKALFLLLVFVFLTGCATVSCSPLEKPTRLTQKIKKERTSSRERQKYGVLISGKTNNFGYRINLMLAYQALLENGFPKDNIFILDDKNGETIYYPVDDHARTENVRKIFDFLAKTVKPQDLLFVYVGDHGLRDFYLIEAGDRKTKQELSAITLPGGNINEYEFARLINKIGFGTGIFVFTQCNGAGFAERLADFGRITIAIEPKERNCYGQSFSQPFFWALRKNKNISIQEAFEFALENGGRKKPFSWQEPFMIDYIRRPVYLGDQLH